MLGSSTIRPLANRLRSRRSDPDPGPPVPPEPMPSSVALSPPPRTHGGLTVQDVGHDPAHVLVLRGELDSDSVATLEEAISRCCHHGPSTITLDLSNLAFIDSSGLWTITIARKWCESHGHGFWLIPGPEHVQYVFEVTGLSDVLPFRKDGSKRG